MKLSGWGRYPVLDCRVVSPRDEAALLGLTTDGPLIARGNGRSYGDAAVNRDLTVDMSRFNRMLAFDAETGVLGVEAGVLLADIVASFLPRGWFPAVTPGTKHVTVGGMIAADVHGKNHHRAGSISRHVEWIDLLGPEGEVVRCSPSENARLFDYTFGGMGLTGVILRAALRLVPVGSAWIRQETLAAQNLEQAMELLESSDRHTYTVAWIDCLAKGAGLGRSLILNGEHAAPEDLPAALRASPYVVPLRRRLTVPVELPRFALNRYAMRAFNAFYYNLGRSRQGTRLVDWDSYFYPLDAIANWNRIYGPKGFTQFQCVIPKPAARQALGEILRRVSDAGSGSFLAVLKLFGAQEGRFSFPMEGYTLALDFPIDNNNLALLGDLENIAADHGGRMYLAKDSHMSRATFERSEDRAAAFRDFRRGLGLDARFASAQSQRLAL